MSNHPQDSGSMAAEAAERVRSIVAAAESEAARIRYEAERDAQQRLREAEGRSLQLLADARRRAEALVDERVRGIDGLSAQVDGARLVALQMAVAGRTREEVQLHLQRAFGVNEILDEVFEHRSGQDLTKARHGAG